MHRALICLGGRRFLLTVGCGAVTCFLCWHGKISGTELRDIIIGTVGAYILGNTYQKSKQIEANNAAD